MVKIINIHGVLWWYWNFKTSFFIIDKYLIFHYIKVKMKTYWLYFSFILSQNSYCQTQTELNDKWCDKLIASELELKTLLDNIKIIYNPDKFLNNLNYAQRNWRLLLQADMEMYMPSKEYWGSSETMCKCQFRIS